MSFKRNLPPNEQGMLDSVLSGSCRWQLRQQGRREKLNTPESRQCECGMLPTGLEHKWLECPLWDAVRSEHKEGVTILRSLPLITQRYGLFVQNSEEVSLRAKYDELPLVRPAVRHGFSGLRVFTDGSAHVPKEVRFRKAGFAVVAYEAGEASIAHRTAGGVPGRQTVPRAELLAGLQGLSLGNNINLSTDCLNLVRQWGKPRSVPYGLMPNGDIWEHLDAVHEEALRDQRPLVLQHVRAHRALSSATSSQDAFNIQGNKDADESVKKAAALGPGLLRLRALHKKRVSQAKLIHGLMLAVQKAYHARLQEVAPRKGDGVVPQNCTQCTLDSWGQEDWEQQTLLDLPLNRPKWCTAASLCDGYFARMVLAWASLLIYPVEEAVDSDPGVTYLELAASFEISMGVPLPSRVGQSSKSGKKLAWKPFDATFGVDDTWADKAAVLRSACVQLTRFVSRVQGYRIPVAALNRRPRFPEQAAVCQALHVQLGSCSAKVGPQSWRPSWKFNQVAIAHELVREMVQSGAV